MSHQRNPLFKQEGEKYLQTRIWLYSLASCMTSSSCREDRILWGHRSHPETDRVNLVSSQRELSHPLFICVFPSSLERENIGLFRSLWLRISCSFELCSSLLLFFFSWSWSVLFSCHSTKRLSLCLVFLSPFSRAEDFLFSLEPLILSCSLSSTFDFISLKSKERKKTAAGDSLYL